MDNGASSYRRFLDGDDEGFIEIIRDYKDGLIFFLNRYTCNIHEAEELVEDTFFRIVTKKPRFNGKYAFKTWLYTIGRNTALNYLKKSKKSADIPDEDIEKLCKDEETLESMYIRREREYMVHKALSKLRTEYASVLHLKYFEDMSNEQIATVMKKNKRQIENLIYQAKRAMKTELDKEDFGYEGL